MSTPLPAVRMIDANLNRASEAVRTLEDLARFTLHLGDLAADLKHIRHGLTAVASRLGWDTLRLAAHRDTPGDPGTAHTTASESRRESLSAIASAASSRAAQALRVLEEATKLTSPAMAHEIEQLRYRLYDSARSVVLALGTGLARQWSLCVLITEAACTEHSWEQVARLACEGGADCLQLREPDLPDAELLRRARMLVALCREHAATSFINDRPDIALLAGADGVHVGQSDLPVPAVRKLAGSSLLVGVSTANIEQAQQAARDGADVCGLGPMFASTTKPKPKLAGIGYLRAYLADPSLSRVPHLAISGITPENSASLAAAGCRGIAVCAQVCGSPDPLAAASELRAAMTPSHAAPDAR